MHRVTYAVKRAHWRSWAAGRRLLRPAGITPARLDVVQCLHVHGGTMMQKALQRVLGVVRSTASEVLSKLEKLGLVTRGRRTRAGRSVTLTERGRRAIGGAYVPQTRVDDGIEHTFGSADMAWVGRILVLERLCRRLRLAFGDSSPGALYGWIDYDW